jgi:hypothetical protein
MSIASVKAFTVAMITVATLTVSAQSQRPAQASMENERAFATELQRAFRTGDRQVVASLVRYPARVSVRQRPFPIYVKDRDALEQMYDMVFTPHVRCAVVDSRQPVSGKPRPKNTLLIASGVVSAAAASCAAAKGAPHGRRS